MVGGIIAALLVGKNDPGFVHNGALAGLVGITAGAYVVTEVGAIIIGLCAGAIVVFGVEFVEKVLKIDDPVGAIGVHGICGAFGTLAVGLFSATTDYCGLGLFYGGGWAQLGVQAIGVVSVMAWVLATSFVLFKTIKMTTGLRVDYSEEINGLDMSEHGSEAYADFSMRGASD